MVTVTQRFTDSTRSERPSCFRIGDDNVCAGGRGAARNDADRAVVFARCSFDTAFRELRWVEPQDTHSIRAPQARADERRRFCEPVYGPHGCRAEATALEARADACIVSARIVFGRCMRTRMSEVEAF